MSKRERRAAEEAAALAWVDANTTPHKPQPAPREHRAAIRRLVKRGVLVSRVAAESAAQVNPDEYVYGSQPVRARVIVSRA